VTNGERKKKKGRGEREREQKKETNINFGISTGESIPTFVSENFPYFFPVTLAHSEYEFLMSHSFYSF